MRVGEGIELRWENMLAGIRAQPGWLVHGPRELLDGARRVLTGPPPPRIYLTGCGDSHYAGLATRLAFERWSGIPTQAVESLELSRYELELAPAGSWAICVSNSGKVVRTVEAATVARERGLRSVAVTYDPSSRLAQAAETTLAFRYDDPGFGPGTISYVASLGALYALAIRAAELAGRSVDGLLESVEAQGPASAETIELAAAPAERLAGSLPDGAAVDVLGGGPSFGTAFFGRAKLIESAHLPGGAHELEEWAHEEYFCTGPGRTTIVVAPPGASHDRAVEQLRAAREIGATAAVVSAPGSAAAEAAELVLPVAGEASEELSPLTYGIPLELLAYHYASARGLTMLGFDDEARKALNFRQIFGEGQV
ncbi:MAG TPA: SIS domain-containing protein [Gaiellaceae bacterium]|nr:SIS domain-containing protein [Gaiellaceae bacterium]